MVRLLKEKLDDLRESVPLGSGSGAEDDNALTEVIEAASRRCPYCEEPVDAESIICIHCGFNAETRDFVRTRVEALRLPTEAEETRRRAGRRRALATATLVPVILLASGLATRAVAGATLLEIPAAVDPLYLTGLGVATLISITALCVIARVWCGGLGPVPLAVIRLAAAFAVIDAVILFVAPIPAIGLAVIALLHIFLVSRLFDLDLGDAAVAGVVTLLLKVCVFLAMGVPWIV